MLRRIVAMLSDTPNLRALTHLVKPGDNFPWDKSGATPEALILAWDSDSLVPEPLRILGDMQPEERPPTLVVGSGFNPDTVRFAMYCGVRDFFSPPVAAEDLIAVLQRIASEGRQRGEGTCGEVNVVIGAKGGVGASCIASNLSHIMSVQFKSKVALMDLDLQYGVQPLNFDIRANNGLVQAILNVHDLDAAALEGWVVKHKSGVHVLASGQEQLMIPEDLPEGGIADLLNLLRLSYSQIVIDLPRRIDVAFADTVGKADRILIVLEQSLAGLHNAKKLTQFLREHLGIHTAWIEFVINRWDRHGHLTAKDIKDALPEAEVSRLPHDYHRINRSLAEGTPLLDLDSHAPITRELVALTSRLIGLESQKQGFIARLIHK